MAIIEKQRYTFFKYFEHYHLDKIQTTRFNQPDDFLDK